MRLEDAKAAPRLSTWSPDLVTCLRVNEFIGGKPVTVQVEPGQRVSEYVRSLTPDLAEDERQHLRVILHEGGVARALDPIALRLAKLKPGAFIEIRPPAPKKGNVLRTILQVVVAVAAFALAGPLGAPLAALFAFGANLLINALVPLKDGLKDNKRSPTYSLDGFQNVADPDGPVPMVVGGRHRFAPKYIVPPIPRIVDGKMYVSCAFVCGFAPMKHYKDRIGERLLERFVKITTEYRGFMDDAGVVDTSPLTVIRKSYIPQPLDIELRKTEDGAEEGDAAFEALPTSLYTDANALSWKVILQFPEGLFKTSKKKGTKKSENVTIRIRERPVTPANDGTWTTLEAGYFIEDEKSRPFFLEYERANDFATRGAYEIEFLRLNDDDDTDREHSVIKIVSFQSILPEYPINQDPDNPFAIVGIDMMATNQLQGTLDEYNMEGCQLIEALNPSTGLYEANKETSNPADWYRWLWTMPIRAEPLNFSDLNGPEIIAWHAHNVTNGCKFSRVYDFTIDLEDVLDEVCQVGYAVKRLSEGLWGVSVDERKDTLSAAPLTPHNTWGFELKRQYRKLPDAWRMKFKDELNEYRDAERLVLRPGFVGTEADAQLIEELEIPGITNPIQVYKYGYRRFLELIHRPDMFADSQDWEAIELEHGNLALISHPMFDQRSSTGRVLSIAENVVITDEPVTMEGAGPFKAFFQRVTKEGGVGVRKIMIRDVVTVDGEHHSLALTGPGDMPEPGDLFGFGPATSFVEEAVVQSVEPDEDGNARINLINYAPQIFDLMDTLPVPPYSSLVGTILPADTRPPAAPKVMSFASSTEDAYDDGETPSDSPRRVIVTLQAGSGVPATARLQVRHRLLSESVWRTPTLEQPVSRPAFRINTGYAKGDTIVVEPTALTRSGIAAAGPTKQHVIGSADPVGPVASGFDASVISQGTVRFVWNEPNATDRAQIYVGPSTATSLAGMSLIHTGYLTSSPYTKDGYAAGNYKAGIVLTDEDGVAGDPQFDPFTVNPEPLASVPEDPRIDNVDSATGVVTYSVRAGVKKNVTAIHIFRAASGAGFGAATELSSPDGGPWFATANQLITIKDTTAGVGAWDYYATSENGSGAQSAPVGPTSTTVGSFVQREDATFLLREDGSKILRETL